MSRFHTFTLFGEEMIMSMKSPIGSVLSCIIVALLTTTANAVITSSSNLTTVSHLDLSGTFVVAEDTGDTNLSGVVVGGSFTFTAPSYFIYSRGRLRQRRAESPGRRRFE